MHERAHLSICDLGIKHHLREIKETHAHLFYLIANKITTTFKIMIKILDLIVREQNILMLKWSLVPDVTGRELLSVFLSEKTLFVHEIIFFE